MKMIDGKLHRYAYLLVYGCQMNQSDAERMMGQLRTIGYERTESMEEADLILINTCCVRETAEDRVYGKIGEIKRLKRENPELIFGITGCMAQKEGDALIKRAPHIDFVLGTNKVHELTHVVQEIQAEHGHVVDVQIGETELPDDVPVARAGSLSAWVPIMYGCNNFCTYCIVPYVRGREKSRTLEAVVAECEKLVADGVREITLLGQNVNSYGRNIYGEPRFAELLRAVGQTGVERIRFTSSNPKDLSEQTIRAMAEVPAVMPHLHLAVQSGSTRVLKAMNRSYTREEYLDLARRLKEAIPGLALSTDIIVGFPGETEEDFEETLSLVKEAGFSSAFTFIYSPRPGTPAAKMPNDTPHEVIQERFDRLADQVARQAHDANQADLGTLSTVLVEGTSKRDDSVLVGHSEKNQTVHFCLPEGLSAKDLIGKIVDVRVLEAKTWYLRGEVEGDPR